MEPVEVLNHALYAMVLPGVTSDRMPGIRSIRCQVKAPWLALR
jgi:hypothetical protein